MLVLTIRTDKPQAEISLHKDGKKLASKQWLAHRQLAETLLGEINRLLVLQGVNLQKNEVQGIVCYKGPGSFTGLRIGLTVGNALAYSWNVPIVGTSGAKWIASGIDRIAKGDNDKVSRPDYGANAHITKPKK